MVSLTPRSPILTYITPIENLYSLITKDFESLSDLFKIKTTLPVLVIFNANNDYSNSVLDKTIEFYPKSLPEKEIQTIRDHIQQTPRHDAFYMPETHAIIVNRNIGLQGNGSIYSVIIHELTHSIVRVENGYLKVDLKEIREFNGYKPGFGNLIVNIMEKYSEIKEVNLGMNEFFPPLAETYLFGKPNVLGVLNWGKEIPRITNKIYKNEALRREGIENKALDWIVHLPQIAGELLVKLYGGDMQKIMIDHPDLPVLDGGSLWKRYGQPLLRTGKL